MIHEKIIKKIVYEFEFSESDKEALKLIFNEKHIEKLKNIFTDRMLFSDFETFIDEITESIKTLSINDTITFSRKEVSIFFDICYYDNSILKVVGQSYKKRSLVKDFCRQIREDILKYVKD